MIRPVLDDALRTCQAVLDPPGADPWDTLVGVGYASALACRYELSGDPDAATAAIETYQRGAADTGLSAFRRLDAAHAGAKLAVRCGETGPGLELYALAIDLLDYAAWRGIDRRDQERLLARYAGLPSDAAAMAIAAGRPETAAGRPETAVECLERGRGVLLDRLLDDSADLARLNEINPALAAQFRELRSALDGIAMPDPEASDFEMPLLYAKAEADELLSLFPTAVHLSEAAATRDAVLAEMGSHCWFHFAVHGVTDGHTPVGGGLQLTNGRLTIRDLAQRRLSDARFAYLSACETYQDSPAIPVGRSLALQLSAHLKKWPGETLLTGADGGQLSPWATRTRRTNGTQEGEGPSRRLPLSRPKALFRLAAHRSRG